MILGFVEVETCQNGVELERKNGRSFQLCGRGPELRGRELVLHKVYCCEFVLDYFVEVVSDHSPL